MNVLKGISVALPFATFVSWTTVFMSASGIYKFLCVAALLPTLMASIYVASRVWGKSNSREQASI